MSRVSPKKETGHLLKIVNLQAPWGSPVPGDDFPGGARKGTGREHTRTRGVGRGLGGHSSRDPREQALRELPRSGPPQHLASHGKMGTQVSCPGWTQPLGPHPCFQSSWPHSGLLSVPAPRKSGRVEELPSPTGAQQGPLGVAGSSPRALRAAWELQVGADCGCGCALGPSLLLSELSSGASSFSGSGHSVLVP